MNKLCECGCGKLTDLATRTRADTGAVRGLPTKFRPGHYIKRVSIDEAITEGWYKPNLNNGFCMCGCGNLAPIANKSRKRRGDLKGFPIKFINGHNKGNWQGGITPENLAARMTPEYIQWRINVFIRDDRSCQVCGQRDDIHAHHLMSFSEYKSLRTELSNGLTLCRKCHEKTYSMDDFKTKEEFLLEFHSLYVL